jgi:gliding motility-associated-like protein
MRFIATTLLLLAVTKCFGQCSGMYVTADKTQACAPAKIQFVLHKVPANSLIMWDFGNGFIQGADTTYQFFLSPQVVMINVKVTMPSNQVCTYSQSTVTNIRNLPEPEFTVSTKVLCDGPDTVQIKSLNKNAIQYNWVVDGTNYYNDKSSITHAFKTVGDKKIALYVIDSFGCRGVKEVDKIIKVYPDVLVDVSADINEGCVPQNVNFIPTLNTFGEKVLSYEWFFPKNKAGLDLNEFPAVRSYIAKGNYDVILSVITDKGCRHSIEKKKYLNFGDSVNINVNFTSKNICVNQNVNLKTNTLLPGIYEWQLNGATILNDKINNERKITYTSPGWYDIGLKYNENKCFSEQIIPKAIYVKEVKSIFNSEDYYHCAIPHNVHFENKSTSTDLGFFQYTWNYFNTDTVLVKSSYKNNDSILISQWGKYSVELIAKHSNGCADTSRQWNYMRLEPIKPAIHAVPQVGCVGQEITFLNATPRSSYISTDSIYWKIYDLNKNIVKTSRSNSPTYVYNQLGKYDVTIHIGNLLGCKDSVAYKDFIEIVKPKIDFLMSDSILCSGGEIVFKGNSQPYRAKFNNQWSISHKNGTPVYKSDTTYFKQLFDVPGEYSLYYAHNIANGCRDSVVIPAQIVINGIEARVNLSANNGCLPFMISANAKINLNYYKGTSDPTVLYKWTVLGGGKYNCNQFDKSSLEIEFLERGNYQLQLEVFNAVGCSYIAYSENISAGVIADFNLNDYRICQGMDIIGLNQSQLRPTEYQWYVNENVVSNLQMINNNAYLSNNKEGNYRIKLVASKFGVCSDSITRNLEVIKVKAIATVSDSILNCAPAYAQFYSNSLNADTLIWDFGDKNVLKTTDKMVANIYDKNSGWGKGFDISLIAQSNEGCSDSSFFSGMIKVRGPVPNFEISNFEGCEPLQVAFKDNSSDVSYVYLNYQDGSPLDSGFVGNHTYKVKNYLNSQNYLPSMYAIDSIGCASVFTPSDTVKVKIRPMANITCNPLFGCSPMVLNFSGSGTGIEKSKWILNNALINNNPSGTEIVKQVGNNTLTLVTTNSMNCNDTSYQIVRVLNKPQIKIILDNEPCLNSLVTLKTVIKSDTTIDDIIWNLVDSEGEVKHYGPNWNLNITQPGLKQLSIKINDILGCTDSSSIVMNVFNPANVYRPQIDFVNVIDNQTIEVVYQKNDYTRFAGRNLYRNDFKDAIYKSSVQNETKYFDKVWLNDQTDAYCYKMNLTDICGFNGQDGREHCQINLKVDNQGLFKLKLNWSDYKGWVENFDYEIYRKKAGEQMIKIATLPAYTTEYLDSPLCNNTYEYCVKAVNLTTNLSSNSNSVVREVRYTFNKSQTDIKNVTVVGNHIELKLSPSLNENFGEFQILKYAVNNPAKTKFFNIKNSIFVDNEVNVNASSYLYQVQERDRCGYLSDMGRIGKTIMLDGEYTNQSSFLGWNKYQEWVSGVDHYNVEIQQNDGSFKLWKALSNSDTSFTDKDLHPEIKGAFCYRIIGISTDLNDTSYSNSVCLFGPSQMHIPNAFSPNGNDLNETFRPTTLFISTNAKVAFLDYDFSVYNRWGELLFMTHDLNEGWDGNYQNKPVQEGSYMYTIRAAGVDNKTYKTKGSVLIIR